MRAYYFGNMYLSSIQQGIQAAHVTHELFNRYPMNGTEVSTYLSNWSENHKTMILLNGGFADNLRTLVKMFDHVSNPYPWALFNEGQDSLDGALTCVGIVLPEKIYQVSAYIRSLSRRDRDAALSDIHSSGIIEMYTPENESIIHELSKWEFELMQEIGNYRMAS